MTARGTWRLKPVSEKIVLKAAILKEIVVGFGFQDELTFNLGKHELTFI